MDDCPCGSNFPYTDCCGPLIRGAVYADTAEDLMRSRYTASVKKEVAYLLETLHPDERPASGKNDSEGQEASIHWEKLEIFSSKNGAREDEEGEVGFVATYSDGADKKHHKEVSSFIKEEGRWYYSQKNSKFQTASPSGPPPAKTFTRKGPKVGRNDPCTCGSGKKYKKCCGK